VRIAMDDFGNGYSNLSDLSQLPIDTPKIDRTFVHDITGCGRNKKDGMIGRDCNRGKPQAYGRGRGNRNAGTVGFFEKSRLRKRTRILFPPADRG